MAIGESMVFYLALGAAVAFAWSVGPHDARRGERSFQLATAVFFWPIYLPLLLAGGRARQSDAAPKARAEGDDAWTAAIGEVERELDEALAGLDGWAGESLGRQRQRIVDLRCAWRRQADHVRDMDRVLTAQAEIASPVAAISQRVGDREESRRKNLARLRVVRDRTADDLLATLASVREIASMVHLAKFTGASASQADALVAQLAAAVEGLTEVADWRQRHPDEQRTCA